MFWIIQQLQFVVADIFKATEQAIAIGDPTTAANKAKVTDAAPVPADMGLVVRPLTSSASPTDTKEKRPTAATVSALILLPAMTDVLILASNANRLGYTVTNPNAAGVALVKEGGAVASATSYTWRVTANGEKDAPFPAYTGDVHAFNPGAVAINVLVTERT